MVRVAADREQRRTTGISLLVAALAAIVVGASWFALRSPAPAPPPRRGLIDYPTTWVCELNDKHVFVAPGRFEPRPCQSCSGTCYIRLSYVCPVHGEPFDVFVVFGRGDGSDAKLGERVVRYRYRATDPWVPSDGTVACPVPGCNAIPRRPHDTWSNAMRRQAATAPPTAPPSH